MPIFTRKPKKSFDLFVVRPSKYDEEGYVVRYLKGVLPSNTLSVLAALAQEAFDSGRLGPDVETRVHILDDVVQEIDVKRLRKRFIGPNRRAAVCLAGVQTNQFPRATDLARRFKDAGFETLIGGFHVSGAIALSETMPPECQALIDAGVTLVKGEVEDCFGDILEDAYHGRLKPFYDIVNKPDIDKAPIPLIDPIYQKHFAYPRMGTIDASRGCPFDCSFCTIINVQGRKMRCRSAEKIAQQVEANFKRHRIDYYFFTDDNFARNKNRDAILDALIDLRENKGVAINFMMQVDTKAWRIPGFVDRASRAGCSQVFIGIESLNAANLEAADKTQNSVDDFGQMIDAWHQGGIACHGTLIIGFPHDTPESVAADVERLKQLGPDQCSFFMLTPLPGSVDHVRNQRNGVWMDPDYNNFDSYHETMRLPNFAPGQWQETYWKAWASFYSFENMRAILRRCNERTYWGIFKNFMWYRNALREGIHPMITGLWRLRPRTDRRPGFAVEGRLRHALRRWREGWQTVRAFVALFFELEELWLQTRLKGETTSPGYLAALRDKLGENVQSLSKSITTQAAGVRDAIGDRTASAREWINESASGVSQRFRAGFDRLQRTREESINLGNNLRGRLARLLVRWNNAGRRGAIQSRAHLRSYWSALGSWVRRGRLIRVAAETPRIMYNFCRDVRLSVTFFVYFLHELTCE